MAARMAAAACLLGAPATTASAQTMVLPGKLDVSGRGAATYSIPIAVPPGTAGMAPALALDYSSQSGNGIVGVGWALDGLPSIGRCPQTRTQDGAMTGVSFSAADRFCMEGQRLVAISGAYGGDGTEYRTEIDGFARVISHGTAGTGPAWFEVHTKSGQIMQFGNSTDSQIMVQGTGTVRSWAVNKVSDTKGNYFTASYASDAANGQAYPAEIDYTGNAAAGVAPYNKVVFAYAARADVVPLYQAGALTQTTLRLTDIEAYAGTTLVSDYKLSYQQGGATGRTRLTGIQGCDGAGACLPATTFGWSSVALSFNAASFWLSGPYGTGNGWTDQNTFPRFVVDVNGDGLPDIVGFGGGGVLVSLNMGGSFGAPQTWSTFFGTQTGWSDDNTYPRFLVDVNGDGLPDIVGFGAEGAYVSLNTGTGFGAAALWSSSFGAASPTGGWSNNTTYPRFLVDVNGDGLPDIVGFGYEGVYVALNTGGTGFGPMTLWSSSFGVGTGWSDNNTFPRLLADVNGDGLPDVVGFGGGGVVVALNTGTGFGPIQPWSSAFGTGTGWSDNTTLPRFLADVNGDGLPDVVGFGGGGVVVALNTGTSFGPIQPWSPSFGTGTGWADNNTFPRFLADVNGDGLPDIVGFGGTGVVVALNTGTSFGSIQPWSPSFGTGTGWSDNNTYPRFVVDVNGDGLADIVGLANSGPYVALETGGSIPDLLTTISNGLGPTTSITYAPLTRNGVYTKQFGDLVPTVDLIGPMYVVFRVDASNAVGGSYGSTYAYVGGRSDIFGRGFLGFRQTVVTDLQTGVVQTTTYDQDFPCLGMIDAKTQTLNGQTLNQTVNTYQDVNAGGGATVSTPTGASAPYQTSLQQSVVSSWDLDGSVIPAVTTTYQYDAYGNPTQVTVATPDGFSKTTVNTYANDTTNWYLGRLTGATVTSTTP